MARQYSRQYKRLRGLEDERKMQERAEIIKIDENSQFHDPTHEVVGTRPEKVIYNYLMKLRVNFEFQYHYPENWDTANQESLWIPDFMLPDYNNTLIEVYGTYWHTMNRDSDQLKKAYWLLDGYTVIEQGIPLSPTGKSNGGKVVIWWDTEIYRGIDFLFSRDLPEIFTAHIPGTVAPEIRDMEKEFWKLKSMRASIAKAKRKPKYVPVPPKIKTIRQNIYEQKR